MTKKVLLINSVKPVQGSVGAEGDVLLKFEVETKDAPMLLHFTSTAASDLKELLKTSITSMRLGDIHKPKP